MFVSGVEHHSTEKRFSNVLVNTKQCILTCVRGFIVDVNVVEVVVEIAAGITVGLVVGEFITMSVAV